MSGDGEYENMRRVCYGDSDDEYGKAYFVPVCPTCGRFVKADDTMLFGAQTICDVPNATCNKCGRVQMPFEGFL